MNPYWGKNFFAFFGVFFTRLLDLLQGKIAFSDLASDEIQIVVLLLLAVSSSLVGSFLVLRKMTMLANSLSHTILLGIVTTFLLTSHSLSLQTIHLKTLIIASLITGLLTTFFTELLVKKLKLQEGASIGLVFTTFFALGMTLVTLFSRNAHIGAEAIMGNVDALHINDVKLVFYLGLANVVIMFLFYKQYQVSTFDPVYAKNVGIPVVFFNYLLMIQTSATAIGAFRAVGVFLFLALLVTPVLTARLFTHRLHTLIFLSISIGAIASIIAVALSRHILSVYHVPLSTSGLIVVVLAAIYLVTVVIKTRNTIFVKANT